jgi:hypothetical protein
MSSDWNFGSTRAFSLHELEEMTPVEFLEVWFAMSRTDRQRVLMEASVTMLVGVRDFVRDELRARVH